MTTSELWPTLGRLRQSGRTVMKLLRYGLTCTAAENVTRTFSGTVDRWGVGVVIAAVVVAAGEEGGGEYLETASLFLRVVTAVAAVAVVEVVVPLLLTRTITGRMSARVGGALKVVETVYVSLMLVLMLVSVLVLVLVLIVVVGLAVAVVGGEVTEKQG